MRPNIAGLTVAPMLLAAAVATAQPSQPSSASGTGQTKNDYAEGKNWLCRPGRSAPDDACHTNLSATVVSADGTLKREAWTADPKAPIDCFYVYPTVSTDQTTNSDMTADPAERQVVRAQFARFGAACRLYAPLYRQVTLVGLRRALAGGPAAAMTGLGYEDVADAWKYYLEHDNRGRGVVLIGHSQGASVLTQLLRQEIDGKPVQSRLVSALLLGTTIGVPRNAVVGGTFQHIPLCQTATQTGCVVTYASYRSNVPPPADTRFGRVRADNQVGACTNPAALGGGSGELHTYLSTTWQTVTNPTPQKKSWVTPAKPVDTPWVTLPGLLTARCVTNEHATYLEVTVHGNPADPRVDDIFGDVTTDGTVQANWGLHLIDAELAIGNLLDIVRSQTRAYAKRAKR